MTTGRASQGLEAFLKHSIDGGGGEWIGDWKKEGELVFWIHPDCDLQNSSYFTHSFFNTKTYDARDDEPEVTKVRWHKFVCCDPDRTAGASRWYEKDGYRQNPPVVCPIDFLLEWTSVEIAAGRLDWKTPIFDFRGDDPKGDRLIRAGGMLGMFGRNDLSKDEISDLRRARIDTHDAFQQDLRSRGGYLLAVIDDAVREEVQKFAIQGTGNPLKSLPGMFKAAIQAVMRGYKVDDPNTGRSVQIPAANPIERPYRFQYIAPPINPKTGRPGGFGEYKVSPLNRPPDAQIRELMAMPCPDLSADREKGNCPELRMIMEQHCVYKNLPIDSFFEAAHKAGLMKPRDEKPKKPPTQPAEVSGRFTDPRSGEALGGGTVECLNCGKSMASDDLTCRACGATYNNDGNLDGLKCLKCKTVVPVNDEDGRHICPKCAAVHVLDYENDAGRAAGRRPVWEIADSSDPNEMLPGDEQNLNGSDDDIPW